jgi:glycosyltransferase involved in cell wall biosynthesis
MPTTQSIREEDVDSLKNMEACRITFLVNGSESSAMGIRARDLIARLPAHFHYDVVHRDGKRIQDIVRFWTVLWKTEPEAVYVFDMAVSGVTAAILYKLVTGTPFIVDTGDAITALARSMGRGPLGLGLTAALEELTLRIADHLVVRGRNHHHLLASRGLLKVTVIPDGVDLDQFKFTAKRDRIRTDLGIGEDLLIGTLGSSHWNERLQTCYGWEMLDVLDRLRDEPVQAIMIGGGDGIDRMKVRAHKLGLETRIHFVGYVPYDELPAYLCAFDIGLSKQTNDVVGQVRTTGKLPLYMACGRYVLSTCVGEAAHVLPDEMLIPFDGVNDPHFTDRLTERIRYLLNDQSNVESGKRNRERARMHFDYDLLGKRLVRVLDAVRSHGK